MNEFMELALNEAKKSLKKGDVPVGAVIVYKNKVISKAHNLKEKKNNPLCHAEILAINKACQKLKKWRLDDCELYVTMEPCMMCTGAIIQARIKKVNYSINNSDFGTLHELENNKKYNINMEVGKGNVESLKMIQDFFKEKRKRKNKGVNK